MQTKIIYKLIWAYQWKTYQGAPFGSAVSADPWWDNGSSRGHKGTDGQRPYSLLQGGLMVPHLILLPLPGKSVNVFHQNLCEACLERIPDEPAEKTVDY